MEDLKYTKTETEFTELQQQIRELGFHELASKLSGVFYKNSNEQFRSGMDMVNKFNS